MDLVKKNDKKKFIVLFLWLMIYVKMNFGIIRSPLLKFLSENNQFVMYLLLSFVIIFIFRQELIIMFKRITMFGVIMSIISAFIITVVNMIFVYVVFQEISFKPVVATGILLMNMLVIGPVYEELIFRFLMLLNSNKRIIRALNIFISVALFTLAHSISYQGNLLSMIQASILGILLAVVYIKTQNIYYSILIHISYNIIITYIGIILN